MSSVTSRPVSKKIGPVDFDDDEELDRALRAGVRDALISHKESGHPVVVWRDGKVVWIPAEEIVIPDEE